MKLLRNNNIYLVICMPTYYENEREFPGRKFEYFDSIQLLTFRIQFSFFQPKR